MPMQCNTTAQHRPPPLPCQVLLPLSPTEVGELSANVRADQKKLMEAAPTEWSANARAARKAAADEQRGSVEEEAGVGGDRSLRVGEDTLFDDSTSQGLLYRLLLAEMQGDGPSGGLNNRWIDRDALLQVRWYKRGRRRCARVHASGKDRPLLCLLFVIEGFHEEQFCLS